MLKIASLTYRIGSRLLLDQAEARIPAGYRVGLIGRNGTGKTTLLRLIMGEAEAESGAVELRRGARIGWLAQEAPGGEQALRDFVLAADRERASLLLEAERATDAARIAEIHARLQAIRADAQPARAAAILAGLGFDETAQARRLSSYSGGWRMRVALAAVLFAEPDLLLLDEPSNHLDLEAALWLENYLRTYPHTLILVSHDRDLLNGVATHIMALEQAKLYLYAGGYDQYERQRRERLERQASLRQRQEAQRRHLQSFVDRFRAKASKARQAQSRIKMLERLQPVAAMIEEAGLELRFPSPAPLSPPIIAMENVSVGYEAANPVLARLNLRIDPDDRIALLGANGNGKSTFARLVAGRLRPFAGSMVVAPKLKVGYFGQHQAEEFDLGRTAFQEMQSAMPERAPTEVRGWLGRFGLSQARGDTRIGDLSGGEKARLLFAMIAREAPHLLILDEPTNHLDIDSREALVQALNDYEGAVIIVSHDRHLLQATADRLWLVESGRVEPYEGDLDDYRERLLGRRHAETTSGVAERNGPSPAHGASARREARRQAADRRAEMQPLRQAAKAAERAIDKLSRERAAIEAELAQGSVYDGPKERLNELLRRQGQIRSEMETLELEWLAAQEALEAAEDGR
ncbi:MAG: ABC-F family ATP-binding cassette domain-containing protein [Alphaproteobacteria bacterium]|nr:ABC-F family ATP-binding cassette domain-containing protein [Alphaproteobacteria bacterium]